MATTMQLYHTFEPIMFPGDGGKEDEEMDTKLPASNPSRLHPSPTPLPMDYSPTSYCVICGKGKECYQHVGNRRFKVLVEMNLQRYVAAKRKAEKSCIVSDIMEMIEQAGGRFVKHVDGRWLQISEAMAREKVGALFRDCLHDQYRSSGKSKTARRRERQIQRAKEQARMSPQEQLSQRLEQALPPQVTMRDMGPPAQRPPRGMASLYHHASLELSSSFDSWEDNDEEEEESLPKNQTKPKETPAVPTKLPTVNWDHNTYYLRQTKKRPSGDEKQR